MAARAGAGSGRQRGQEEGCNCDLFGCFCCWRRYCSPRIPRVAPGKDFVCIPAGASDSPAWSVLVGCTSTQVPFHNLRTHRFRVAASGRVIGDSNDELEPFRAVCPDDDVNTIISYATATLSPDGRRLHGLCTHTPAVDGAFVYGEMAEEEEEEEEDVLEQSTPRAFSIDLATKALYPAPDPPFMGGAYLSVSAHGHLWAPVVLVDPRYAGQLGWVRLCVHRLDDTTGAWQEVANHSIDHHPPVDSSFGGSYLRGYAVIRDRYILLSLVNITFLCFDCQHSTLTTVTTVGQQSKYIPISGKALHFGGDDNMLYFLDCATLLAYNFSPEEAKLFHPPTMVDRLWPYLEEGYGSVVLLAGRMLCAVWINMNMPCGCAARHVLITTLLVKGVHSQEDGHTFLPTGVEVLHSTCRMLGMLRSRAVPEFECLDTFSFLQEYPDHVAELDLSLHSMTRGLSYLQVGGFPEMRRCCRHFQTGGVPVLTECTLVTRPHFYFICQIDHRCLLYQITISAGKLTCHGKELEAQLCLNTFRSGKCGLDEPPSWHFVLQTSKLYVIPSLPEHNMYEVDVENNVYNPVESKRPGVCFSVVSRAGQYTVALGDFLHEVYILDQGTFIWTPCKTSSITLDLTRKVNISGFVDIQDDAFVISEAGTAECFLLDLRRREWFVVKLPTDEIWQYVNGLLCGRCLFSEGFIYSCRDDGLLVYELIKEDAYSYCIRWPVNLQFSHKFSNRRLISFDSICEENNPGSMVLCIVEGNPMTGAFSSSHTLTITTVEVKLEVTPRGSRVPTRIDHIDVSLSSVINKGWIWTNYAFSV